MSEARACDDWDTPIEAFDDLVPIAKGRRESLRARAFLAILNQRMEFRQALRHRTLLPASRGTWWRYHDPTSGQHGSREGPDIELHTRRAFDTCGDFRARLSNDDLLNGRQLRRAVIIDHQDDLINFKVNSIRSDKALPMEYYKLPYCQPDHIVSSAENLGEVLRGDRIFNSLYQIQMRLDERCKVVCRVVALTPPQVKQIHEAIEYEYR